MKVSLSTRKEKIHLNNTSDCVSHYVSYVLCISQFSHLECFVAFKYMHNVIDYKIRIHLLKSDCVYDLAYTQQAIG